MSDKARTDKFELEAEAEGSDTRTPREGRAKEQRPSDAWVPPSTLPVPEPKDGWVFRWIRTSLFERGDGKNVSRRFREGWEAVKASEHPELYVMNDIDSRFPDCIEQGGLLLCKMPEEKVKQRQAYYETKNQQQIEAVDEHYMRENNPRMPKFADKKTRTSFGSD